MIEVTFLGTSSAIPTKKRNHSAILLVREGKRLLFDCGEGTQRQITLAGGKATKLDYVFITHWHADHSAGLHPMLYSMQMNERKKELTIVGPYGTKEKIELLKKVLGGRLGFKVEVKEALPKNPEKIIDEKDFEVWGVKVKHTARSLAFSFIEKDKVKINVDYTKKFGLTQHPLLGKLQKGEDIVYKEKKIEFSKATRVKKGKKISYTGDAVLAQGLIDLCNDSDILISDASFSVEEKEWRDSKEMKHMLTVEAAELAKQSASRKLYLTHFSRRYSSAKRLVDECRKVFKNSFAARDFLKIRLS